MLLLLLLFPLLSQLFPGAASSTPVICWHRVYDNANRPLSEPPVESDAKFQNPRIKIQEDMLRSPPNISYRGVKGGCQNSVEGCNLFLLDTKGHIQNFKALGQPM